MCRLFAILIIAATVLASVGCNKNLRCERETALLRAEILDLEDKYYALQAQQRPAVATGSQFGPGVIVGNGTVSPGVIVDGYVQPSIQNDIIYGDVIYEGESYPTQSYPAQTYPAQTYPAQTYPAQTYPTESYPTQSYPMDSGAGYGISGAPIITTNEVYYDGAGAPSESATIDDGIFLDSETGSIPAEIIDASPAEQGDLPARSESTILEPPTDDSSIDDDGASLDLRFEDFNAEQTQVELDSPDIEISFEEEFNEPVIAAIAINANASRGENIDGKPGDDGLNLLIETRTKFGEVVDGVGKVTVQVTDPTSTNGSRLIGEWTFLPDETELFLSRDEFNQRGILLHLPWENRIPQGSLLNVQVVFETSDGRRLQTSNSLQINPPAVAAAKADQNLVTGWTARDRRWVTDPAHNLADRSPVTNRGVTRSAGPRLIGPQPQLTQPIGSFQNQWQSNGRGNFTRSGTPVRSASPMPNTVQPPEWKPVR